MAHLWTVVFLFAATPVLGEDLYALDCDAKTCAVAAWEPPSAAPFRHLGVTLESNRPPLKAWDKLRYRMMLARFSTPKACLTRQARSKTAIDLARFDWSLLASRRALEVCLFRVHDAMRSAERSESWFGLQGYRTRLDRKQEGHFREGETVLFADWVQGSKAPAEGFALGKGRIPYSFAIRQGPTGEVLNINISLSVK